MFSKTEEKNRVPAEIHEPYRLLLLAAIVLAVYYPAMFSEYSIIDDHGLINALKNGGPISFKGIFGIFVPGIHDGAYYRPFLFLSYISDRFLFDLDPLFMHFENVLFHVLNTLLVFWLAWQLDSSPNRGKPLVPLFSALIFGLHPINTESVNWISGRTDVLAGMFVLLSANMLLLFKNVKHYGYLIAASVFAFMGFLTKEVAVAFVPGALLIFSAHVPETDSEDVFTTGSNTHIRNNLFLFAGASGVLILYLALRFSAFLSHEARFGWTLEIITTQPFHAFFVFLGAFGFYLKKLFLPFPLNFTITGIDPLYEILAVPLLWLCLYIAAQRTLRSALFIAGILLIAPAFPLAIGKIAWTPYAERYLYISSSFVTVASVSFIADRVRTIQFRFNLKWVKAGAGLMLILLMIGTLGRNIVWMHNETLLKDSVEKNPAFQTIRIDYAYILAEKGNLQKAREHLTIAASYEQPEFAKVISKLYRRQFDNAGYIDFGFAYLYEREGKSDKALSSYTAAFEKTYNDELKEHALNRIIPLYTKKLSTAPNNAELQKIKKQLLVYGQKLYNLNGDAQLLYMTGKLFLQRGEKSEARRFLMMAHEKFPDKSDYKVFSAKLIERT